MENQMKTYPWDEVNKKYKNGGVGCVIPLPITPKQKEEYYKLYNSFTNKKKNQVCGFICELEFMKLIKKNEVQQIPLVLHILKYMSLQRTSEDVEKIITSRMNGELENQIL